MRFSLSTAALCLLLAASAALGQAPCGYVSVSNKPPVAKDVYPVTLRQIDGAPPRQLEGRIKLAAGMHKIVVQQNIAGESRGRSQLKKMAVSDQPLANKEIDVDVQADGHYMIAARLLVDARGAQSDYWEPVVWRKLLESCE